jgi:hypothetical protein
MQVDADRLIDDRPISPADARFCAGALVAVLTRSTAWRSVSRGRARKLADVAGGILAGFGGPLCGHRRHRCRADADRFGRKPSLVFTTALFGVFTCLTPFAESFSVLVLYRLIAGLGLGGATPCFITMAAEYAPARNRAMLVSLLWAGYPLGNSVGGFVASYLIPNFHWSAVFYAGGIPTLIIAALLLFFMPESLRYLAARGVGPQAEQAARKLDPSLPQAGIELIARAKAPQMKAPLADLFTDGRAAGRRFLVRAFRVCDDDGHRSQTPTLSCGPLQHSSTSASRRHQLGGDRRGVAGMLVQRLASSVPSCFPLSLAQCWSPGSVPSLSPRCSLLAA